MCRRMRVPFIGSHDDCLYIYMHAVGQSSKKTCITLYGLLRCIISCVNRQRNYRGVTREITTASYKKTQSLHIQLYTNFKTINFKLSTLLFTAACTSFLQIIYLYIREAGCEKFTNNLSFSVLLLHV